MPFVSMLANFRLARGESRVSASPNGEPCAGGPIGAYMKFSIRLSDRIGLPGPLRRQVPSHAVLFDGFFPAHPPLLALPQAPLDFDRDFGNNAA